MKKKKNNDELQQAKDAALRLLAYRPRSSLELKRSLAAKGFAPQIIEEVIAKLNELAYLDDQKFAEDWIKYRIKNYPRGRQLIIKELRDKGIAPPIIDKVILKTFPRQLESELGLKLAWKWLKKHQQEPEQVIKLSRYLQNKGFSYDLISDIIKQISG